MTQPSWHSPEMLPVVAVGSGTLIQRCFLDDEGLGPVVGVAQPVHLDADMRDVRILGAITSIRVLRK